MKPQKLTIEAFGPYSEKQMLDFTRVEKLGLFLIHGNTGAGKSSLLEAMVWALYGKLGNDKKNNQVRYAKSPPEQNCMVTLEFKIGQTLYSISRQLQAQFNRQKELLDYKEKAVLSKFNGTEFIPFPESKLDQIYDLVSDLLGMNHDQFIKIIMIPQGQFKDLLLAKQEEKEKLLSELLKLNRIDIYTNYLTELVKEKKQKLVGIDTERRTIESQIKAIEGGPDEQTQSIDELKALVERLDHQARELVSQIDQNKQFIQWQNDIKLLEEQKLELENFVPTKIHLEAELIKFRQIKEILPLLNERTHLEKNYKDASSTIAEKEQLVKSLDLSALKIEIKNAKTILDEIEEKNREIIPELKILLSEKVQVEKEQKESEELFSQLEKARLVLLPEEEKISKARKTETDYRNNLTNLELLIKAHSNCQEAFRTLSTYRERAIINQNLLIKLQTKKTKYLNSVMRHRDCKDQLPVLRTVVSRWEQMETKLHHAEFAQNLTEGTACMVCGSEHHPQKATFPEDYDLERSQKDKDALISLEQSYIEADKDFKSDRDQVKEIETEVGALQPDLLKAKQAYISSISPCFIYVKNDDLEKLLEECISQDLLLKKSAEVSDELTKFGTKLRIEKEQIEALKPKENIVELEARFQVAKANCDNLSINYERLKTQIEKKYIEKPSLKISKTEIENQIREIESNQLSKTEKYNSLSQKYNESEKSLLTWKTEIASLESKLNETRERQKFISDSLSNREIPETIPEYSLDFEEASRAKIDDWKSNTAQVDSSLAQLRKLLEGKEIVDLSKLEADLKLIQAELLEKQTQIGRIENNLSTIKKFAEMKAELDKLYLAEGEVFQQIEHIKNGMTGGIGGLSFKAFVLGIYLDRILIEANYHLGEMTSGRYQFSRNNKKLGNAKKLGLNMDIIDAFSGEPRMINTLSGGESFMASLSLALGLSSYIQKTSGGRNLEAFFIDEGFGTLDEDALDHAISVLENISKSGKMLGIISHVRELKERIPLKLEIRSSSTGSSFAWNT